MTGRQLTPVTTAPSTEKPCNRRNCWLEMHAFSSATPSLTALPLASTCVSMQHLDLPASCLEAGAHAHCSDVLESKSCLNNASKLTALRCCSGGLSSRLWRWSSGTCPVLCLSPRSFGAQTSVCIPCARTPTRWRSFLCLQRTNAACMRLVPSTFQAFESCAVASLVQRHTLQASAPLELPAWHTGRSSSTHAGRRSAAAAASPLLSCCIHQRGICGWRSAQHMADLLNSELIGASSTTDKRTFRCRAASGHPPGGTGSGPWKPARTYSGDAPVECNRARMCQRLGVHGRLTFRFCTTWNSVFITIVPACRRWFRAAHSRLLAASFDCHCETEACSVDRAHNQSTGTERFLSTRCPSSVTVPFLRSCSDGNRVKLSFAPAAEQCCYSSASVPPPGLSSSSAAVGSSASAPE